VVEAAPNYGEEWSYNYELRQFGGAEEISDGGDPHFLVGRIASRAEEHRRRLTNVKMHR
jgi:hypothetical protein